MNYSKATPIELETAREAVLEATGFVHTAFEQLCGDIHNDSVELAHAAIMRAQAQLALADRTLRVTVNRIKRERGA